MKIGFDAKRAYNNVAGLGNFSRRTIVALARQYPNDCYFLFNPAEKKPLFTAPENSTEIKPEGFWNAFPNAWRSYQITSKAKELNLEIYHGLSHELPIGIEKTGIKSIVTIHDLIYLRYPQYFQKIDRSIYDLKFRHSCRVATRIHAISEQTKQDLISFLNVPEEKIDVIYQAINTLFFQVCTEEQKLTVLDKYQLPTQFLLNVGTIEPRKNLVGLLNGMLLANLKIPLVVVGKPTHYIREVQQLIEKHQSDLKVYFLPGIEDVDLQALYQSAVAMIYPSVFEGFGLPVVEAQASGCPVITSNISSLPEAGGEAALYIHPLNAEEIGQAIRKLMDETDLRESLIAKAKVNAQRFTANIYARQLKQLYNSILND
ncbi:MAG TPA: glycosyltransferase family 1 protein [Prolixibacteraceae bacterium]|jgi:glycosyltransferase involved in cell wall biosynthesis|nr:glycosyltransferase family 1 protein [Prolixibacteraceae bacterium]